MNTNSNDTRDVKIEVKTIVHWLTANDADKELGDALTDGWHVMDITVLALPGDIKRVVTMKRIVKPQAPSEYTTVSYESVVKAVVDNRTSPPPPPPADDESAVKDEAQKPAPAIVYGVQLPDELEAFPRGVSVNTPYAKAARDPRVRAPHLRQIRKHQDKLREHQDMTMDDVPEGTTYAEAIERGYPTHICSQIGNKEAMDAGMRKYREGMERWQAMMNRPRPWDKAN